MDRSSGGEVRRDERYNSYIPLLFRGRLLTSRLFRIYNLHDRSSFLPSPEEIEFGQFKRSFSVSIEIFSTITEEVEGGRARAVSAGSSEEIQRTGRGGLSVPS